MMGIARVIEAAGEQGLAQIRDELTGFLNRLMDALFALQCPDGRFHDILDEPESFADGTSAMMAAATVYRGVLHGYVCRSRCDRAEAAYRTVREQIDGMGLVHGVCGCPDFLSEGTSAEAQAAFIMADAWRDRLNGAGRPDEQSNQ